MGAAWKATSEVGGGADSIINFLMHGSAGGTIVSSRGMSAHGDNESEVRGISYDFLKTGNT